MKNLKDTMQKLINAGLGDKPLSDGMEVIHNDRTGKHTFHKKLFLNGEYKAVYTEQDGPGPCWIVGGDSEDLKWYKSTVDSFLVYNPLKVLKTANEIFKHLTEKEAEEARLIEAENFARLKFSNPRRKDASNKITVS